MALDVSIADPQPLIARYEWRWQGAAGGAEGSSEARCYVTAQARLTAQLDTARAPELDASRA